MVATSPSRSPRSTRGRPCADSAELWSSTSCQSNSHCPARSIGVFSLAGFNGRSWLVRVMENSHSRVATPGPPQFLPPLAPPTPPPLLRSRPLTSSPITFLCIHRNARPPTTQGEIFSPPPIAQRNGCSGCAATSQP